MVPAGSAVFVNAGSGFTTVALRSKDGQWDNNFRLETQQNRIYDFGTAQFEIVLDAQSPQSRVQKILDTGDTYVIYYDFAQNRWDIKRERDYP